MTGVPPGSQRLRVKVPGRPEVWADDDERLIGSYGLVKGVEIEVGFFWSLFFPVISCFMFFWVSGCELLLFHWKSSLACQIWTLFILGHQGYEAVDS